MQLAKRFVKAGVSDIVLIAIIIMSIFPFIYMFMMSFKSTINAFDFDFSLDKLTLEQYVKVFQVDNFERYIFNSVFVAVGRRDPDSGGMFSGRFRLRKMDFKGINKWFISWC